MHQVETGAKDLTPEQRRIIRAAQAKRIAEALHKWMLAKRREVPDGSGTAKAPDYSLKRWTTLTRYLDEGAGPIDNHWVENHIQPWALSRSNWLFTCSLRTAQRAAASLPLIQSTKLNGHDPYVYLKDVLSRLPTQKQRHRRVTARTTGGRLSTCNRRTLAAGEEFR